MQPDRRWRSAWKSAQACRREALLAQGGQQIAAFQVAAPAGTGPDRTPRACRSSATLPTTRRCRSPPPFNLGNIGAQTRVCRPVAGLPRPADLQAGRARCGPAVRAAGWECPTALAACRLAVVPDTPVRHFGLTISKLTVTLDAADGRVADGTRPKFVGKGAHAALSRAAARGSSPHLPTPRRCPGVPPRHGRPGRQPCGTVGAAARQVRDPRSIADCVQLMTLQRDPSW